MSGSGDTVVNINHPPSWSSQEGGEGRLNQADQEIKLNFHHGKSFGGKKQRHMHENKLVQDNCAGRVVIETFVRRREALNH